MAIAVEKPALQASEARTLAENIKKHYNSAKFSFLEFVERKGHVALGYATLEDCVQAEFNFSRSTFYRMVEDEQVKRDIGVSGQPTVIPSAAIKPLKALPPEQRAAAWDTAVDRAGVSSPPPSVVKAAVAEHVARTPPPAKPSVLSAPVRQDVQREPGDDEGEEEQSAGPDDMAWVKMLPAYDHLSGHNLDVFVADSLAWRHLRKHVDTFRIIARREIAPVEKRIVGQLPPWISRLNFIFRWKGPHEWQACRECQVDGISTGVLTVVGKREKCGACSGHGYHIK